MKKVMLLALSCLSFQLLFSQLQYGFHYVISNRFKIYYSGDGHERTKKIYGNPLKANIKQDKEKLSIEFWGLVKAKDPADGYNEYVNSQDKIDQFYLKIDQRKILSDVTRYLSIPWNAWEVGVTTVPFKYHYGSKDAGIPNDASVNINAGVYFGKKWGRTRFYISKDPTNSFAVTFAGFISPTVIAISGDNTSPKATVKSNEIGLSPGLALLVSKQDFNIGILGGWDLGLSDASKAWYYNNKFWIGFGIGYKLAILNGGK